MENIDIVSEPIAIASTKLMELNYVRVFSIILAGVFAGYTLQPVPNWLNNLFNTSIILKFVVLFFCGLGIIYGNINKNSILWIVVGSILILVMFEIFRKID